MDIQQLVRIMAYANGLNQKSVAEKNGYSPQAFSQKLKRGSFTPDELKEIAKSCDCEYKTVITFPDGNIIEL